MRLTARNKTGEAYYPKCFEAPCEGMGCKIDLCPHSIQICEKLAGFEDAEDEGRLIITPCALGTPMYFVDCWEDTGVWEIFEYIFDGIEAAGLRMKHTTYEDVDIFPPEELGKSIFLDRQQAEQVLKLNMALDKSDKIQLIAKYEEENKIPYAESVTSWFGDMALFELKLGATEEQFNAAYEKAVEYFRDKEAVGEG